jgi:hypothetical protein
MGAMIGAEQVIRVGEGVTVGSDSPGTQYAVVFEDDGETGYFYGLDNSTEGNPILDALHIYNVAAVSDRDKSSVAQILWSTDGLKAALVINGYPHAVFDFAAKRGYCRTNFPPPDRNWTEFGHEWSDAAIALFQ